MLTELTVTAKKGKLLYKVKTIKLSELINRVGLVNRIPT